MLYREVDQITVGRYGLTVTVGRNGVIAQTAQGKLTGKTPRQLLAEAVGIETDLRMVGWKRFKILKFEYEPIFSNGKTTGAERWYIEFDQLENPVPVMAILAGVAVLAGILLVYLTFDKLEAIAQHAPLLVNALGLAIIAAIGLYLWRKFSPS